MRKIVESIPNFSEGRDAAKVGAIVAAIESVPGVAVLDREMDSDHHRSVITMAGEPEAVVEAAVRAAAKAVELIDLNQHVGVHPRIGALDVLPLVPISGVTMEECVGLARLAGARIAEELGVPIYLYERAATRPDRVDLADVRRSQFEKLREEIITDPRRYPDFGSPQLHPTAGAMAVGARMPLIACNVNLATDDLAIARRIARAVRGRDGGLRYVKALGLELRHRRQVQVSMNLVNHEATPLFRVFEMIRLEAERYGVAIAGCEIVGLIPQAALNSAADYYLRLENYSPDIVLENRLQAVLPGLAVEIDHGQPSALVSAAQPAGRKDGENLGQKEAQSHLTLDAFVAEVGSITPTLAGGSVAAYAGSLAAALGAMVCRVSSAQHPAFADDFGRVLRQLEQISDDLRLAVREEAEARINVLDAIALPRTNEAERLARINAIEQATRNAIAIPLRVVENSRESLELLRELSEMGTGVALTDLAAGAQIAVAALAAAACTIVSQLVLGNDDELSQTRRLELRQSIERGRAIASEIEELFFSVYPL